MMLVAVVPSKQRSEHFGKSVWIALIAVDLLEKFTRKGVITPDSEEGGVITPEFTSPVKVAKNPFLKEKY